MTILMTLIGILIALGTLVLTKLNFKKAFGVLLAFMGIGVFIDLFLATYANLIIGALAQ